MKNFHLVISSPDGSIFDGDVVCISLRGASGELAVLADHAPFITSVVPCRCKITFDDESEKFGQIESGLLSVEKQKTVLSLSKFEWIENE